MTPPQRRAAWAAGLFAAVLLLLMLGLWVISVVVPQDPFASALVGRFPWPVACSLRGCITMTAWQQHWQVRQTFARAAEQEAPGQTEALTTLVRQHLVRHAFLHVPITRPDAVRYREEVLGLKDEGAVREVTQLSLDDYDERVLFPLLQQEALRQERSIESLDELFTSLARERALVVFSRHLKWNKDTARVEER